jgi:prepilin peptidase CpaA
MDALPFATSHMIALCVAVTACVWDLRTRRIPNVLTLGAAAAAVAFHLVTGGMDAALAGIGGWCVGVALLFVPFALGAMGGGDVKLLGALGAWLGPGDAVWLALYTGIAGGVFALVVAALLGYLPQAMRNIWSLLMFWRVMGPRPMPSLTLESGRGPRVAYAAPILAGMVVTLWLR